jgi:hypothetical protein
MQQVLDVRDQKQGAGWAWDMHNTPPLLMQVELQDYSLIIHIIN